MHRQVKNLTSIRMNNYVVVVPNFCLGGTPLLSAQIGFSNVSGIYDPETLEFTVSTNMTNAQYRAAAIVAAQAYATTNGYTIIGWQFLTDDPKNLLKALVAGGAGNVTFYTDTNGDGTGTAVWPNLTADNVTCFVDSVSDQYAFPTITVASNKKSVTVNVQKQSFSTGLAGLLSVLTAASYVNAANGIAVKMIVGSAS